MYFNKEVKFFSGYRNFPRIYTDETTAQEEKSWQKTCFYCYGRKAFLLHMKIIEFLYNVKEI